MLAFHASGSRLDSAQKTRCGFSGSASFIARFEHLPPTRDAFVHLLTPGAVGLAFQERHEIAKRLGAVADQTHLHRIPDADDPAVDVDLDAPRLPEYGKLLPTISSVSQFIMRSEFGGVPSRPIAPVTNGRWSGTAALPTNALATPPRACRPPR